MGQILNRIFRLVKSELNESRPADPIAAEDAELKRIIDELNRDKQREKEKAKSSEDKKEQSREQSREKRASGPKQMTVAEACSILGVPANADIDAIKSAYRTRMKEYHPDRVENLGEELKNLAWKKTQEFNEAYDYLKMIKHF